MTIQEFKDKVDQIVFDNTTGEVSPGEINGLLKDAVDLKDGQYVRLLNKQQLEERIITEGTRYSTTVALQGVHLTGASQLVGVIANVGFKDFYIKNLYITTNNDAKFTLEGGITNDVTGTEFMLLNVDKGMTVIPINYLQRQNLYGFRLFLTYMVDMYPLALNAYSDKNLVVTKGTLTNNSNGKFTYTVTVTNSSGASITGTKIIDLIPSKMKYLSSVGTGWTITEDNGIVSAETTDAIANAGTKTFTVTVQALNMAQVTLSADGYLVDHDINFDAPAIVWNGTSITAASSPSSYKQSYTYLIRNHLRDVKGITTRIINRAISGSTSSFHEAARSFDNRYDLPEIPWGAVWEHGINDQTQSVPIATTVQNAIEYYNHMRRRSVDTWVFIFAPYPNGNSPIETGLITLRAALKSAFLPLMENDDRLKYMESMGTLFNVSDEATYTSDKTHLNNAGNVLVTNAFISEIENLDLKPML